MRRLTILLFFAAILSLPTAAGPIDVAQALQNAAQFQQTRMARSGMHKASSYTEMPQHVYTHNTTDGQPAIYVFNTGADGYVIASADDEAMTILGYSTEGSFDPENIPVGMKHMFDLYAEEIGSLCTSSVSAQASGQAPAARAPRKAEATMPYTVHYTDPIEPLLETRWGQLQPYNRYCPFMVEMSDNGAASATGCMTTALAQIMRYHEWPKRGQGTTFMNVKRGLAYDPTTIKYYEHTYNWDVMYAHRNDYPYTISSDGKRRIYSTGEPSVHNVSQLMFDLGVALRTEYGTSSGAATIRILPALLNHFDYDPGMQLVKRANLSSYEDWNDIVISELQAKRPVYLDGINDDRTIGHAFVCDGYDGKGFFHINWGWDGTSNNYFLMTALNPTSQGVGGSNSGYSNSLILLRGMQPNKTGVKFDPYVACVDRKPIAERPGYLPAWGIWVENPGEGRDLELIEEYEMKAGQWFAASLSTGPNMDVHGKLGIYVVKPDGSSEITWHSNGEAIQMLSGVGFEAFHVNIKDSWKHDGVRAFYVYKPEDKDEIRYIYNHDGQICSFTFREKNSKVYAVIDRSKPGSSTIEPDPVNPDPTDPVEPDPIDPDDPDASSNAQLANIYVGYGTTALDLYPAFDPEVHLYLARRASTYIDLPGSCLILASNTYTISGFPADKGAKVSETMMLRPMSGWNRATITCTAADKKTKEDYHIIFLGDGGNYGADITKKPVSITDLTLMLRMLQPDYGYPAANPNDNYFGRLVNLYQFEELQNLLLKR